MELSNRTVDILKNFSNINPNIVVEPGNVLKTVSAAKNLMARAQIEETFPSKFGIYDLSEFLSVINLVDNPQITFAEKNCVVADGSGLSSVKYFYSDPDMLTSPKKDITMPDCEVKFLLNNETLSKLKRAASALGYAEISVKPSNGAIELSVVDGKNATSNSFSITVEGSYPADTNFNFIVQVSNLKLVNEDYEVGMSSRLISNFQSLQSQTQYYIALEKTSTYGV